MRRRRPFSTLLAREQAARLAGEQAAQRIARLQAITVALGEALTVDQVADVIIGQGLAELGAYGGIVALLTPDGSAFVNRRSVGYPPEIQARFAEFSRDDALPIADAVRQGAPIILESLRERRAAYPHLAPVHNVGGEGAIVAWPLYARGQTIGGLGLSFPGDRTLTVDDRAFIQALAQQCAQSLDRAQLYDAQHVARERLAFLAEATALLASSLDYELTLAHIVQLALGRIADWCSIYLSDPAGGGRWVAARTADPARQTVLDELHASYPPERIPTTVVARVLASGAAEYIPELNADMLASIAADARHLELYQAIGVRSYMVVPLAVGGTLRGVLVAALGQSGRRYSRDDLLLAEELARRAALALENARLYAAEQQARAAAEAAVTLRDQFLAVAAHELRTPLTVVLGQAELLARRLRQEDRSSERDRRAVDAIVSQSVRLNQLMMLLLDVGRLQQGRLPLELAPLDIDALARRVVAEMQPTLERHSLRYSAPAAQLTIHGDGLRLEQVLLNLISNAVKYSPQGGCVEVRVAGAGQAATISVADEGIGIPRADLPQLFQRFYRASNVNVQQISGMGVGLYVVKEIVTMHGGALNVASQEGRGTTITITLPLTGAE